MNFDDSRQGDDHGPRRPVLRAAREGTADSGKRSNSSTYIYREDLSDPTEHSAWLYAVMRTKIAAPARARKESASPGARRPLARGARPERGTEDGGWIVIRPSHSVPNESRFWWYERVPSTVRFGGYSRHVPLTMIASSSSISGGRLLAEFRDGAL